MKKKHTESGTLDKFPQMIYSLPGFCPEMKSIWTNGSMSLKKVGIFRKYGAQVNFPYMTPMVYQHLEKLKRLRNY